MALLMGSVGVSAENRPPNFVFILTDDISAEDLSIYGNQKIDTPHLERLAMKGLVFDNAYLTTSSCSPSRVSMITGRYPHNTGAPEIHVELPSSQNWTNQTGDNIPNNPTPHKATLEGKLLEWERREMPGDATAAFQINYPGPIMIDPDLWGFN
ncbi:MAG: sulfatase-like hydrolase/transferase [Cyclobacteriaceae bacterium]